MSTVYQSSSWRWQTICSSVFQNSSSWSCGPCCSLIGPFWLVDLCYLSSPFPCECLLMQLCFTCWSFFHHQCFEPRLSWSLLKSSFPFCVDRLPFFFLSVRDHVWAQQCRVRSTQHSYTSSFVAVIWNLSDKVKFRLQNFCHARPIPLSIFLPGVLLNDTTCPRWRCM